jgi:hypothetical protein
LLAVDAFAITAVELEPGSTIPRGGSLLLTMSGTNQQQVTGEQPSLQQEHCNRVSSTTLCAVTRFDFVTASSCAAAEAASNRLQGYLPALVEYRRGDCYSRPPCVLLLLLLLSLGGLVL